MAGKDIYITDFDRKRLMILIKSNTEPSNESYLKELESELKRAHIVSSKEIPDNVVTMNSRVVIKFTDTNEEITYQLVFPEDADIDKGRISILAPIGTALLGYRVGDTIEWKVPAGVTKIQVIKIIYQPEAAGDYNL